MSFKYGQNRDEDEDGYQIIGTPFPPLEADEIVSRRPEIDQTVRDERGRRRFHGAFTGGFSAGYWNTVGSAEGFTPKIFKSSRKDKYDRNQLASKPEDFMDDEDFGSFGIAPKKIHTKDDYVENFTVSSLKDSQMTFDEVIRSVFQPSKESIGKRLYRKMKRLAKLDENLQMDQDYSDKNQTDQPIQSNNVQVTKTNRHGLGYYGMLNTDEVYNESKYSNRSDKNAVITTMKSGRRLQITGEAFGYGALEEDDAMDIYGTDDISQYDFEIGSKVARKPTPVKKSITNNQNIKIQIEGFQICRGSFNLFADVKRKYRPPELPSNWKPPKRKRTETSGENKKSRWDTDRKSDSGQSEIIPEQPEQSKPIIKQKVMNSNLRAIILGENIVHKSGIVTKTPNKDDRKELEFSKEIAKPVANVVPTMKTPLSGYFASKFTRSSTTSSHTLAGDKPLSAGLNTYQTMSSLSADERRRNESNDAQNDDDKPPIRSVYEWHPHKILCKRFGVQNPYPQFTDIVGIVCMNQSDKSRNMVVRLNATANNSGGGGQSTKPPLFANLFEDLNQPQTMSEPEIPKSEPQKPQPKLVDQNEDDDEEEEAEARPPPPKPPIDLFKSIFESDEEEEDDEEREKQVQGTSSTNEEQPDLLKNQDDVMMIRNDVNSTKNYGIFSGIDFDQLEQESFVLSNASTSNVAINSNENPNKREDNYNDDDDEEDYYGPALPPTSSHSLGALNRLDNQYIGIKKIEKSSNKSKKKKRKKSKKMKIEKSANKKDKKRKRKKTKRSRRRSSLSSPSSTKSSDSAEETSSTSDNETNKLDDDGHVKDKIVELIKKVKHYKQHSNHHD